MRTGRVHSGAVRDQECHESFVADARCRHQRRESGQRQPIDRRAGSDRPARGLCVPQADGNDERIVASGLASRPRPKAVAGKHERRACQDDQAAQNQAGPVLS